MAFDSLADFLAMGGHGLYVWLAYGSSAFIISVLIALPLIKHRKIKQNIRLRKQFAQQQR